MPLLPGNIFRHVQSENLGKVTKALSVKRTHYGIRSVIFIRTNLQSCEFQWTLNSSYAISGKF